MEGGHVLGHSTEAVLMLRVSLGWFLKVTAEKVCTSEIF